MLKKFLAAIVFLTGGNVAQANVFNLAGTHIPNEVGVFQFTVGIDGPLSLYTNSDFDTVLAVWSQFGSDWKLLDQNDDAPWDTSTNIYGSSNPQNSGITLNNVAAGTYLATVTGYGNLTVGPVGSLFSQGFTREDIYQAGDYTLTIDGTNVTPVPEAEEWTMMMLGLGMMGIVAHRKKSVLA